MEKTILFIHGMFQNAKSWQPWVEYFTAKGYKCVATSWLLHEGEPAQLRANPSPELGDLRLKELVAQFEGECRKLGNPIVVGHSVGGLLVQLLVQKKVCSLGVCVSSVAPNMMMSFDMNFLKNATTIMNPLKGNEIFEMDEKTFHGAFANTLSEAQVGPAYAKSATHDSRNVLRDCLGPVGHVDLDEAHAPLLFIAGSEDHIIPAKLNNKNCEAYTDENSITSFKEFASRSHFICGEPGWEEVAEYAFNWIEKQQPSGGSFGEQLRGTNR